MDEELRRGSGPVSPSAFLPDLTIRFPVGKFVEIQGMLFTVTVATNNMDLMLKYYGPDRRLS